MMVYVSLRDSGKAGYIEIDIDNVLLGLCPDKAKFIAEELQGPLEQAITELATTDRVYLQCLPVKPEEED